MEFATNYVCHFWYRFMFARSFLISCQIKINFTWNIILYCIPLYLYNNSRTHCHSVRSLQIVYFINSRKEIYKKADSAFVLCERRRQTPLFCCYFQTISKHRKTSHDLCCIIKSKSHERARVCVCLRFRFKYAIFLSFTTIYFSHFDILLPHRRLCFILYYFICICNFFSRSIFALCSVWICDLLNCANLIVSVSTYRSECDVLRLQTHRIFFQGEMDICHFYYLNFVGRWRARAGRDQRRHPHRPHIHAPHCF